MLNVEVLDEALNMSRAHVIVTTEPEAPDLPDTPDPDPGVPSTPTEPDEPEDDGLPFTDVKTRDWFYDNVVYVYENGLMDGVSDTLFDPDGTVTRGMIVTILHRLEGEPESDFKLPFDDVKEGQWYAEAVRWAAGEGIVNGVSETEFAPNAAVTREQLAAILHRYAQHKGYDVSIGESTNILSYSDFASISEYAISAMQWVCGEGIITGVTESTLEPQGTATRAQSAAMLMRFIENASK